MDNRLDIDTSVWFPDAFIPALKPYGLERVPGYRLLPGVTLPTGWRPTPGEPSFEDPSWRQEHKDWAFELRDVARPWIHERGNRDPDFAERERLLCEDDPNYFGAVYGWIFDPKPRDDEPMHKPYAKFAYQCHNTSAQQRIIAEPFRSWLWRDKSRQLGISVDDEMFDTWFYLSQFGQAKLISRSEKWVYNGSSYEAMLGKVIYNLRKLDEHTPYLLPAGHNVHKLLMSPNFRDMVLTNPITGTALLGESTTQKAGRGGTYTYVRPDESAFIRDLEETLTSAGGATYHIFPASTASLEMGDDWLNLWQAAKREKPESVFEFNWHQNAYLDLAWERDVLANALTPESKEGLQREFFRDPFAGFGVWTYPEARDLIKDANQPYNPDEPLDTIMDPAGTGDDFAFFAAQPTAIDGNLGFHVLFGYQKTQPNPLRVAHILTGIRPERGDDCWPWEPDNEEQALMKFYYDAWMAGRELRFFMDPAGDQIHSKASFWTQFRDETRTLRQREYERLLAINIAREEEGQPPLPLPEPKPIAPKFKAIKAHRLFGDREYALRPMIPFITVQVGVESAAWVRTCLARTRYNDLSDAAITEPKRRHDKHSHQASNAENYAIYFRYGFVDPLDSKAMRKLQKSLGLRAGGGIPAGFKAGGVPKGFGKNAIPARFRHDDRPPPPTGRASPGSWSR